MASERETQVGGWNRKGLRGTFWDDGMLEVLRGVYLSNSSNCVQVIVHFVVYNLHKKSSHRTSCSGDLRELMTVTDAKLTDPLLHACWCIKPCSAEPRLEECTARRKTVFPGLDNPLTAP